MGSVTVAAVINDIVTITQDTKKRYWSENEIIEAINAAQREIVNQRPDACSVLALHTCQNTATQTIPADGIRFLDATHNNHNGYVIEPIERMALDQVQRQWQNTANAEDTVEHYIYDDRFPKQFKLFPVPVAGVEIEIGYSKAPEPVEAEGTISLDDIYYNPIVDYALAKLYEKNTSLTSAAQKSVAYYNKFYQSLGVKLQADMSASPSNPANRAD